MNVQLIENSSWLFLLYSFGSSIVACSNNRILMVSRAVKYNTATTGKHCHFSLTQESCHSSFTFDEELNRHPSLQTVDLDSELSCGDWVY